MLAAESAGPGLPDLLALAGLLALLGLLAPLGLVVISGRERGDSARARNNEELGERGPFLPAPLAASTAPFAPPRDDCRDGGDFVLVDFRDCGELALGDLGSRCVCS
jgi:hypothetical protein